jgi:hypothetical protein
MLLPMGKRILDIRRKRFTTDLGQNKEASPMQPRLRGVVTRSRKMPQRGCANAQVGRPNAQVDCVKCSVSTPEGICCACSMYSSGEHTDLCKPFRLSGRSVRRRTARTAMNGPYSTAQRCTSQP